MPAVHAYPLVHPGDNKARETAGEAAAEKAAEAAGPDKAGPTGQANHADQSVPGAPPVMLGYLRLGQLTMSPAQVTALFSDYARRNGFWLAEVFIEQDSTTPAAFDSLLRAAKQRAAHVIAVPSVDHLAVLGSTPLNHMLERITGAQLHEMDQVPVEIGRARAST